MQAKIIYNDPTIESFVIEFGERIGAEVEFRKSLEEEITELKKRQPGLAIGSPMPDAFIDFGRYLLVFFLGAMWDGLRGDLYKAVKLGIKKLIQKLKANATKKYFYFLIVGGVNLNEFEKNVYFFIPLDASETKMGAALDKIPLVISRVTDLEKDVVIEGSLRFFYQEGNFVLKELAKPD